MEVKKPSDSVLSALGLGAFGDSGLPYMTVGEFPHYSNKLYRQWFLDQVLLPLVSLRVFQKSTDTALQVSVMSGKFLNADALVEYAGSSAQALTDNATNYIYLLADGTLTINTTGFPVPSVTSHIRLAEVVTASGAIVGITDRRDTAMFSLAGGSGGAGALNTLDWQESVLDEVDFVIAEPGSPTLGDRYINTVTGTSSWTSQAVTANNIYQYNGTTWTEIVPTEGACCLVEDSDMLVGFNGASWIDIGTFALLAEAQTFFAATDITGAEAEQLTDGSNADTLHTHDTAGLAENAVKTATVDNRAVTDIKRGHMTVEENTAGVGSPNVLTADESRKVLTNEGATATNYHTLPTAAAGLSFPFIAADASNKIRITAAAGDKIRVAGVESVAAGYIESTGQGDTIMLIATDEEYWYATSIIGIWDVEVS